MRALAASIAALLVALPACGEGERNGLRSSPEAGDRPPPRAPAETRPEPARCPAGVAGCRSASGRVLYVERVDPDGDGDAHFVLLSDESVTAPGISVVDVERSLRPRPLPGPGDLLSAAGPVQSGSYGQRQIHAIALNVGGG
jgi:hypothetical protein